MTRKPLSPEAKAELQNAMRKACERMEARNRNTDIEAEAPKGVLAALDEQPREA